MAKTYIRIDLDCKFTDLFRKNPTAFWEACMEDRMGLFLKAYQKAYRPRGLSFFGKKAPAYSPKDFPALRRWSPQGGELLIIYLPKPVEPDLAMYHMAYGISCSRQGDSLRQIQLHILQFNLLGSPTIVRVDRTGQTIVLGTTEDPRHQKDMLWRAAFGNRIDPTTDTEMLMDPAGHPKFRTQAVPTCEKLPAYTESGDCWAGPQKNPAGNRNEQNSHFIDFSNLTSDPPEEIDLSQFRLTEPLFPGSGMSPEEEEQRKNQLAAYHKCSPEEIRLMSTIHGGTYSISRGSGGHYLYEEFDDNHRCVWMESIST